MESKAQSHPESNSNHVVAGIRPVSLLKIIALERVSTIDLRMKVTRRILPSREMLVHPSEFPIQAYRQTCVTGPQDNMESQRGLHQHSVPNVQSPELCKTPVAMTSCWIIEIDSRMFLGTAGYGVSDMKYCRAKSTHR